MPDSVDWSLYIAVALAILPLVLSSFAIVMFAGVDFSRFLIAFSLSTLLTASLMAFITKKPTPDAIPLWLFLYFLAFNAALLFLNSRLPTIWRLAILWMLLAYALFMLSPVRT